MPTFMPDGRVFIDADLTDQLDRAIAKGAALANRVPQARAVRFDRETGQVEVDLSNGCRFAFPSRLIEGLQGQSAADIAGVTISGIGFGLHWAALDLDVSLPDLMAGLFGTRVWMDSQRAAIAGSGRSQAKSAAAQRNGAKGGRPRKAGL